jgi:hypothetical protein
MTKRADYEPMTLGNMREHGRRGWTYPATDRIAGIVAPWMCRHIPTV